MPHELATTDLDTITEDLVDRVATGIMTEDSVEDALRNSAAEWWLARKGELVGLGVSEVREVILSFTGDDAGTKRREKYDALVAAMTFEEKIEFMRLGIEDIKSHTSSNIRLAGFFATVVETAANLLPILALAV